MLVIVRLPFAVPTDPIFAARSELYENSFMQYAVPDAMLRFPPGLWAPDPHQDGSRRGGAVR